MRSLGAEDSTADGGGDLREELSIPRGATVFGCYGGASSFDLALAREVVIELSSTRRDLYFVFMNIPAFCHNDRVRFLPGSTDLFFEDIVTFNLRVFANIGEITGKNEGFLKATRVSLRADNLFDAQRKVRDSNGDTPINYQPFVIDPVGLYVGIDLRKLF